MVNIQESKCVCESFKPFKYCWIFEGFANDTQSWVSVWAWKLAFLSSSCNRHADVRVRRNKGTRFSFTVFFYERKYADVEMGRRSLCSRSPLVSHTTFMFNRKKNEFSTFLCTVSMNLSLVHFIFTAYLWNLSRFSRPAWPRRQCD